MNVSKENNKKMIDKLDRNMVQRSYDYLLNQIQELEEKKQAAIDMQSPAGYSLARKIEAQILKKREELEGVKYALDNMT